MGKLIGIIIASTDDDYKKFLPAVAARLAKQKNISLEEAKACIIHCQASLDGTLTFVNADESLSSLTGEDVDLYLSAHGTTINSKASGANGAEVMSAINEYGVNRDIDTIVEPAKFVAALTAAAPNIRSLSCTLECCQAAKPVVRGNKPQPNLQERLHRAAQQHIGAVQTLAHQFLIMNTPDGELRLYDQMNKNYSPHDAEVILREKRGQNNTLYHYFKTLKSRASAQPFIDFLNRENKLEEEKTHLLYLCRLVFNKAELDEMKKQLDSCSSTTAFFSIASSIEEQAKTKITRLKQDYDANLFKPHVGSSIVTYAHNKQLLHFDYITQQQSADYFKNSVRDKLNHLDPRTDL